MPHNPPPYTPLFIHANGVDHMAFIAGLVQDAMFPNMDIQYRVNEQIFVIVVNRFAWEYEPPTPPYIRTHSILHFAQVISVESQHTAPYTDRVYSILSMIPVPTHDGNIWIYISCAGGQNIRLKVSAIDIVIKDVGTAWHTPTKPHHETMILEA